MSAQLKKHQYDTVFAADALQTQPDAIVLDLGLLGGNGFIVLERLKANTMLSGIPGIIMTADESSESELKGLAAGAVAFLHKPVPEGALIAAGRARSVALQNARSAIPGCCDERTVRVVPALGDPKGRRLGGL